MFGADRFVDGVAAAARNLGIPALLVGLVVVGFATSAPELLVASTAAVNGNPSIAIGNAIGSNIANVGLVIGITALVLPLSVNSRVLGQEMPIMFIAMALALGLCWDRQLDRVDGLVLAAGLIAALSAIAWLGMRAGRNDRLVQEVEEHASATMSTTRAVLLIVIGLAALLIGADRLVTGAVTIAEHFGVSDLVIGLTIVAIGTSLPELAASIASALKGEPEIALGNVIGSNMFNILGVMAAPALILPSRLEDAVMTRDMPVMFILTLALYAMARGRNGRVNRLEGALLLLAFVGYQYVLYSDSLA